MLSETMARTLGHTLARRMEWPQWSYLGTEHQAELLIRSVEPTFCRLLPLCSISLSSQRRRMWMKSAVSYSQQKFPPDEKPPNETTALARPQRSHTHNQKLETTCFQIATENKKGIVSGGDLNSINVLCSVTLHVTTVFEIFFNVEKANAPAPSIPRCWLFTFSLFVCDLAC